MFSYSKKFMGKRKASVRVDNANWSDPFTLDTIEDAGKVSCKAKTEVFSVGVNINMSKSSLTKIITFTPFYMVYNTTEVDVEVWELESGDQEDSHVKVGPGQMVPFWPHHGATEVNIHGHTGHQIAERSVNKHLSSYKASCYITVACPT